MFGKPARIAAFLAASLILSYAGLGPPAQSPNSREAAEALARADPEPEAGIRAAVALREAAVAKGDKGGFLALLGTEDPEFLLERSRWFDYRASAEIVA